MSGFVAVVICNMVLFGLVRWFSDAEFFKKFGNHRMLEVIGVGTFCLALYLFGLLNGLGMLGIETGRDHLTPLAGVLIGVGTLTGLPWVIAYARLLIDTVAGVADTIFGLNTNLVDQADLKVAHKHLKKGERPEAIAELKYLHQKYPEAHSPLFVLAILADEDKEYDQAVDYYREIIQKNPDDQLIWTNAARSLADLLRGKLDDEAGAKNLEAEILKRNPDTKYKYSTTAAPAKNKKQKKKRNTQVEKADINQARRLVTRGELQQAIALMKRYLAENPEDSRSYFELISLFERTERTDDAIVWLQKTIHAFGEDDHVWGEAMLRLAGLREHEEHDLDATIAVLEQIAKRLKDGKHGKLARDQLKEIRSRAERSSGNE